MNERKLKQKLRQLKRIELIARFGITDANVNMKSQPVILFWDSYFSDKYGRAKYPFDIMLVMNEEGRRRVFSDYLHAVYTDAYEKKGMLVPDGFENHMFFDFDLPEGASREDVKKKFRELAKIAHPDHGGSNEAMAALLEQYHKLLQDK